MGRIFDEELARLAGEQRAGEQRRETGSELVKASTADRLRRLRSELEASSKAEAGVIDCRQEGESLLVSVMGQTVVQWTNESSVLTLYRAGSPTPECQATSVAEAAKLTARLVAAVAQA
ncbi:MAG: hypothetical protein WC807_01570 [Hyphomicrobium sp.]|jgi:hypothetical protein